MTDHDLRSALLDHVRGDEPLFRASPDVAIARGRRVRRQRRALSALPIALVLAACAATTHVLLAEPPRTSSPDRSAYASSADPTIRRLEQRVSAKVGAAGTSLPEPETFVRDGAWASGPNPRSTSHYSVLYRLGGDHTVAAMTGGMYVSQVPAASAWCRPTLGDHTAISCHAEDVGDGRFVVTSVGAVGPTRDDGTYEMLDARRLGAGDHLYRRVVEVVDSRSAYLARASETVSAADVAAAERAWTVPVSVLRDIADDPRLAPRLAHRSS